MTNRRPVDPVDAAWLRMDSASNPMVITTVFRFAAELSDDSLKATFDRLLEHRRFRQRVVADRTLTRAAWEDDPDFDLSLHVERVRLPAPGDDAALERFIGERMSTPLARDRALWHIDVIDGVGAGAALLVRVHHAVGDGVALVRLLLGVSGAGKEGAPVEVGITPAGKPRTVRAFVDRTRAQAATLARLLTLPADVPTSLRGELGVRKVAAFSRPIPVDVIKSLARAAGGHVNDLLAAAVAGAVRDHLADPRGVRALVPVFIRGDRGGAGNHFGLAYLPLPVDEPSRKARLRAVKKEMDTIKSAPDATVAFVVLGAMGLASPSLERFGIELFTKKASMLITNVPGPAATVRVADQDVTSIVVWAPTSGSIGLGFSLLTYAGELRLGVAADAGLLPDPHALVACFEREIDGMRAELGLAAN
ncbi:MAG: DUF1298 domain-containing protein [Deltaproteobacteria bacterium]|nr:DUF1298 domain-containing protein [Deltaproteobacteria bacterium]